MTRPVVDEWVCKVCKARYVVRPLARDCEKKHEVRASEDN